MPTITDYRNPHYSAEGINQIDLEILTNKYGWIPITIILNDNDAQEHIIQIKQWLITNVDLIAAYVPIAISIEQLQQQARQLRDSILSGCDWTQMSDVALPNADAWVTYRQALRDVSSDVNWGNDPISAVSIIVENKP